MRKAWRLLRICWDNYESSGLRRSFSYGEEFSGLDMLERSCILMTKNIWKKGGVLIVWIYARLVIL